MNFHITNSRDLHPERPHIMAMLKEKIPLNVNISSKRQYFIVADILKFSIVGRT